MKEAYHWLFIEIFLLTDEDGKPTLKNVEVICTIPCRSLLMPSYYHSFGMTDNYIIFVEQPFKLDILRMATAYMRGVSWASCLKFCPEEKVRHHVCQCVGVATCWYETEFEC